MMPRNTSESHTAKRDAGRFYVRVGHGWSRAADDKIHCYPPVADAEFADGPLCGTPMTWALDKPGDNDLVCDKCIIAFWIAMGVTPDQVAEFEHEAEKKRLLNKS